MRKAFVATVAMCLSVVVGGAGYASENLFNGKDFTGWKQLNGQAKYVVEDGMVVGITTLGEPNSFMCTKKMYSDFILEYDMKCTVGLNSGVQIRSNSFPDYKDGRVHGYQVECDTSSRRWSGGIYDEARRGWLYAMDANPRGKKAFRNGEWNTFRVEAIGDSIRTFINGVPCADLVDNMTPKGFIALQVHSIGNNAEEAGKKIYWKNIRITTDNVAAQASPVDLSFPQVNNIPNTLTAKEKAQGWRLLWDGKTTKGWRSIKSDTFPKKGWAIKDGVLAIEGTGGGDIITDRPYKNFDLQVNFKLTKGANSGIKYFINPEHGNVGCEYQILDDKIHPDAKKGINGNRTLASLYDLIPASSPHGKRVNQYGWNNARIVVNGAHGEHWLNNVEMVKYTRGTDAWRKFVATSKFKSKPWFGKADQGHILLQDHGDVVYYRSIKIRVLD